MARQGVDWTVAEDTRLEAEALTRAANLQRRDGPTLEAELRDYVEKKRRAKDGFALKARTKSDYLAAIEPPRVTKSGTRRAAGPLHPIAHKALATLTASDIRATYEAAARRSLRRAEYAMQILRAVLRWNGVVIPGNPLGRETAGRDRITIMTGKGDPTPIPPELLGAWWRAAERAPSQVASDYYRFQLLTAAAWRSTGTSCTCIHRSRWETSTIERAGFFFGTRRTAAITSCCCPGRRSRSRSATALGERRMNPCFRSWTPGRR